VHKAVDSGLVDVVGDELWVHDWALYNGDLAARVAAFCAKFPQASANEVHRFTGGNRAAVLQMVREYRQGGTAGGTKGTTEAVPANHSPDAQSGTASGTGPHPREVQEQAGKASRSAVRRQPAEPAGLTHISDDITAALGDNPIGGEP